jgi:hypothetical protein
MWQFARLQEGPYDLDPRTVNIAIPDMQLFSLPQTTENKAEIVPACLADGSDSSFELLNTFAFRLTASPISVPVPISIGRGVVGTVGVRWIYGV